IGCDVRGVDGAERRLHGQAAGVTLAVRSRVAHHAQARCGNVLAPLHLLVRETALRLDRVNGGLPYVGEYRRCKQDHNDQRPAKKGGASRSHTLPSLRADNAALTLSGVNGASRRRTPVASKIALAIAAAPGTEAD